MAAPSPTIKPPWEGGTGRGGRKRAEKSLQSSPMCGVAELYVVESTRRAGLGKIPKLPCPNPSKDGNSKRQLSHGLINSSLMKRALWALQSQQHAAPSVSPSAQTPLRVLLRGTSSAAGKHQQGSRVSNSRYGVIWKYVTGFRHLPGPCSKF